jgi:hypothetical protein
MDLLTFLCHEMGRVLGLGQSSAAGDVMAAGLSAGVRDMTVPGDLPGGGHRAVDAVLAELAIGPTRRPGGRRGRLA